jgi:hypothetical protein
MTAAWVPVADVDGILPDACGRLFCESCGGCMWCYGDESSCLSEGSHCWSPPAELEQARLRAWEARW